MTSTEIQATQASAQTAPSVRSRYVWPALAVAGALAQTALLWRGVERARAFAARGRRYQRRVDTPVSRIVILGDSTGVGIGAERPEDSIAGLLAVEFPQADILNISRSGARVADVARQARRCARLGWHFDLALLHVGGNDVLRATPITELVVASHSLMEEMQRLAKRTIWLGHLDIGLAPLFPRPYSWLMSARSRAAARVFASCADAHTVQFIDFSSSNHSEYFLRQRRDCFAVDGLHPSSTAYRYGYSAARAAIQGHCGAASAVPADVRAR